jgi:diaminopimelate decarboxylase
MVARVTEGWNVKLIVRAWPLYLRQCGRAADPHGPGQAQRPSTDPFVIVDAAMNDLARPALYGAYHEFEAVAPTGSADDRQYRRPDLRDRRHLRDGARMRRLEAGDLAVFRTAGAYGATMASTYNSRGFVPEVLVDGDKFAVVADRIAAAAIMEAERVPDWLK